MLPLPLLNGDEGGGDLTMEADSITLGGRWMWILPVEVISPRPLLHGDGDGIGRGRRYKFERTLRKE
ncbi:unnamed protein product [Linum trigynum]|uniref:Uncharacterized protein n=1 Tax=Linum trigynum TaxID=586398 RepID=A0AAV2G9A0_9ROSI